MTLEERIEQEAEIFAESKQYNRFDNPAWFNSKNSFIADWKACIEQEEWKNLYAEGIEMGKKIQKAIDSGKLID